MSWSTNTSRGPDLHWTVQVVTTLILICVACLIALALYVNIVNEDLCWDHGYAEPIAYNGTTYCFGKAGEPVAVPLDSLVDRNGE